jgi:molybdopterin-guanine dinucleotide biosynthesis protein A
MDKKQITGIILCGGKSKRMGTDKALLKLGKFNLLEIAILTLEPFCDEILLSSNIEYPLEKTLTYIPDKYDNIGPISGIYSALSESKNEHHIIITCDTPFLTTNTIQFILENAEQYDIVLPQVNGKIQSLTGYFNISVLPFIESEIQKKHYKPIQMFMECKHKILPIDYSLPFYNQNLFLNINSQENYDEACRIFGNISQ